MQVSHRTYRQFARSQVDMPIFSKGWYLDAVYGDTWDVITIERNGQIVASLPFVKKKKMIYQLINQHFFTQTLGPYIHPDFRQAKQETKLLSELIEKLPKFDLFDQNFSPLITNWLPFKWEGFQQTTLYNYVIPNISDLDLVWKNFSSNYRNKIRKAENLVEIATDRSLENFYDTAKMTFERQGIKMIYDFDLLSQFDSRLYMECRNKIFFALDKKTGKTHSVLYLTLGDESAYLHLAGENPELRNSGAGIYLIWKAIQYASQEENLKKFDFQGSMLPQVERVRRECGGIQTPYSRVWKYNSQSLKWLKKLV